MGGIKRSFLRVVALLVLLGAIGFAVQPVLASAETPRALPVGAQIQGVGGLSDLTPVSDTPQTPRQPLKSIGLGQVVIDSGPALAACARLLMACIQTYQGSPDRLNPDYYSGGKTG